MPALEADLKTLPVTGPALAFLLLVARDRSWTRTAQVQAQHLGLKDRHALRSHLLALNLPRWGFLKRWFRVYDLVARAEGGDPFAQAALAEGHNPSTIYRTLEGLLNLKPGAILLRGGTALLLPALVTELDRIRAHLDAGQASSA